MKCALYQCPLARFVNGKASHFCQVHEMEFQGSPEGRNRRPCSEADFRDRMWKEHCVRVAQAKWDAATPEQRAEWQKGGFGR